MLELINMTLTHTVAEADLPLTRAVLGCDGSFHIATGPTPSTTTTTTTHACQGHWRLSSRWCSASPAKHLLAAAMLGASDTTALPSFAGDSKTVSMSSDSFYSAMQRRGMRYIDDMQVFAHATISLAVSGSPSSPLLACAHGSHTRAPATAPDVFLTQVLDGGMQLCVELASRLLGASDASSGDSEGQWAFMPVSFGHVATPLSVASTASTATRVSVHAGIDAVSRGGSGTRAVVTAWVRVTCADSGKLFLSADRVRMQAFRNLAGARAPGTRQGTAKVPQPPAHGPAGMSSSAARARGSGHMAHAPPASQPQAAMPGAYTDVIFPVALPLLPQAKGQLPVGVDTAQVLHFVLTTDRVEKDMFSAIHAETLAAPHAVAVPVQSESSSPSTSPGSGPASAVASAIARCFQDAQSTTAAVAMVVIDPVLLSQHRCSDVYWTILWVLQQLQHVLQGQHATPAPKAASAEALALVVPQHDGDDGSFLQLWGACKALARVCWSEHRFPRCAALAPLSTASSSSSQSAVAVVLMAA